MTVPPPPPGGGGPTSPPPSPPPPPGGPRRPAAGENQLSRQRTGLAGLHSLRDQPSPYSVSLAVVVVLITVSPNVVFVLLDLVLVDQVPRDTEMTEGQLIFGLIFALIVQVVVFVVALAPLLIRRRLDRRLFGPSEPTGTWVALGLGLVSGVLALFAAYSVNIILGLLAGIEEPVEQHLLQSALRGGIALVLAGSIALLVAPITEEVVFRGILFRALADRVGLWVGAIASAAVFALIHVEVVVSQPVALGGLFTVGLILAIAYYYTGNLLVPVLGHAVFNGSSLALALAFDRLDLDEASEAVSSVSWIARVLVGG